MTVKELREKQQKLIADARTLLAPALASGQPLSGDDKTKIDTMRAEATSLGEMVRQAEELEAEDRALATATVPDSQRAGVVVTPDQAAREEAFKRFVQFGERREQSLTAGEGGYTVAPNISFYGKVISAMKDYSGVEKAPCTVLNTATGADLPIPTNDDTGNSGELVAEAGTHASGTAITLGQTTLKSYLYSSKIVKVSLQLLRDSEIAWESFLAQKFGERLGRAKNTALTTGTGSSQPQGVQYVAHVGRQAATGNATSVTFDEVLRAFHSLDPAYRNSNCRWMMSDASALILRIIKNGDGQYIWRSSVTDGAPDSLFGYQVLINPDMPTMTATYKPIIFGDFTHYFIRNVSGIEVVRLNELYAANGQVGFMAFCRFDGALVDAANHPIVALQNSAA
jgi:HK97 family phage major capsid protein